MTVKFQTISIKLKAFAKAPYIRQCRSVRASIEAYPKDELGWLSRHIAVRTAMALAGDNTSTGTRRRAHRRNWLTATRFMPHETTVA